MEDAEPMVSGGNQGGHIISVCISPALNDKTGQRSERDKRKDAMKDDITVHRLAVLRDEVGSP